jgi:hypothetical protein
MVLKIRQDTTERCDANTCTAFVSEDSEICVEFTHPKTMLYSK